VTSSLELLMDLVDASCQTRNAGALAAAVREVNRIHAAKANDEVGRMTGGWLKSVRQKA
jgi:hypothetical protein